MRSWFCLPAVLLVATGLAPAADPTLEVRVRSVNDLLARAEYLGGLVNQAEAARQGAEFARSLADLGGDRGIEGIDPARPVGLYATLTKDVIDSPVVLMVPLASEEAFLALLTGKLNLEPKKGKGGVYEVAVPNFPAPVFFRFANRTVYITLQSAKGVEEKTLIDPKPFFAAPEDAVASVKLHLDRVPADVRKALFGQFELRLNDAKAKEEPGETPARRKLKAFALDQVASLVHTILTDGKTVSIRLAIEPKVDELALDLMLTPAGGSGLARAVRDAGGPSAPAAVLAGVKDPVAAGSVHLALPESVRAELGPIIDALVKEEVEKAKGSERQAVRMALEAVAPTLKAGVLDAAVAVTANDSGKGLALVAGLKVAGGAGIEKTLRTFAPFIPDNQGKLEFDVKKLGELPVHRATSSDANLKDAFGTDTIWLATGGDLLLVAIEPEGKRLAAVAGAAGRPTTVPPLAVELSIARLLALAEKSLAPEVMGKLTETAFAGKPVGKDTLRLTAQGGDTLTVRAAVKGSAVRLAVIVDQEKKK
jgi:hypothetical protein